MPLSVLPPTLPFSSSEMTVNRNCCSESADSAVCPADAEDYEQVDRLAQEGYRITYYRCEVSGNCIVVRPSAYSIINFAYFTVVFVSLQEDLCNDDTSDDDSEEENYGDGAVIVEGKQDEDYEYPEDDSDGDDEDEEEDDDDDDEEEEEESDEEEEESGTVRAQLVTTTTTSLVVTSSLSLIRLL